MSTVIEKKDKQGGYRVFSKGASEVMLKKCKYIMNKDGQPEDLTEQDQRWITRNIIEFMAGNGLRTICVAYK